MIVDNLEGLVVFRHPEHDLSPAKPQSVLARIRKNTDFVSCLVCWQCEYVAFCFHLRSNAAVIEPSLRMAPAILSWTSFGLFAVSACVIVSSPQHVVACLQRLLALGTYPNILG